MWKIFPIALCLVSPNGSYPGADAFAAQKVSVSSSTLFQSRFDTKIPSSSYNIDSDGEAEQVIGEKDIPSIDGVGIADTEANGVFSAGRYDELIADVGLEGQLKQVATLPGRRKISSFDVFCNRELKQSKLAAVGFDMDYTICQYKKPAFDRLAFDGAKEKLVHNLGYPEEVLDFEYDHEVNICCHEVGVAKIAVC